jgi:hypothetical protein
VVSVFAWLDHDESERRRMQEAIELFREHDTIDELGIGSVRDAFSNLLFPGTSVLHTRARYLLFIPWIYVGLERRHVRSADAADAARRAEIGLIEALLAGGEERDVIGARARAGLKQLPSEAYWTGLRTLGLLLFPGTRAQYHRSFDALNRAAREAPHAEDEEPVESWARLNWHPTVAKLEPKDGFLDETTFALSPDEAAYLRERIIASVPESLFAFLVTSTAPTASVPVPWAHPAMATLPTGLAEELAFARAFSEVMWGSSLLFNLLLAELTENDHLIGRYESALNRWESAMSPLPSPWDWSEFWSVALRGNPYLARMQRTSRFVENWFALALELGAGVRSDARARDLISVREWQVKGAQARLHSLSARERWTGASGTAQLSYRWPVVTRIVDDIHNGLHNGDHGDARA